MYEGAACDDQGHRCSRGTLLLKTTGNGRGKCSCGAMSDPLPSAVARKRWHRAHKLALIEETP